MRFFWGIVALLVLIAALALAYSRLAHVAPRDPEPVGPVSVDPLAGKTPTPTNTNTTNGNGTANINNAGKTSTDMTSTSTTKNGTQTNAGGDTKPDTGAMTTKPGPSADDPEATNNTARTKTPDAAHTASPDHPAPKPPVKPEQPTKPAESVKITPESTRQLATVGTGTPASGTAATNSTATLTSTTTPQSTPREPLRQLTYSPSRLDEYEVKPGTFETREDGSIRADGAYIVRGEGTRMKPYIVPWDLLVSAEREFETKSGTKMIPERVAMLHDKFVRIDGYTSFSAAQRSPRELLCTLNPWDGCCIGVPPTPYDAVEVNLKDAVKGDARFATSGSVEGRLKLKPYLVSNWLIGLYVMDEAKFQPLEIKGGEQ